MAINTKEKKLINWVIILPIIAVLLTSFVLTNIFITSIKDNHEIEMENIKNTHLNNLKNTIQERIQHISILLTNNYKYQLLTSKNNIKDIVEIGYDMLNDIYKNNKHLTKKELYKKIDNKMKNIRFFNNSSGYYFIYDLSDGVSISLPPNPNMVGTSLINLKDKYGKNLFNSYGEILNKKGQGFDEWYWNKPNEKEKLKKIGYIKKFEPLNIAIGTAVYKEDIDEKITQNIKSFISDLIYKDNSYIFIFNKEGVAIEHKNKFFIKKQLKELDEKHQQIVKRILQKAESSNGDFLEYLYPKNFLEKNQEIIKKISFVKTVPILNWVVGTGLYTDDLTKIIENKERYLDEKLITDIKKIILVSLFVTLIIIILLILISNKLKNIFKFYSKEIEKNNLELKKLNDNLESKIKYEVKINRDKDQLLFQQSKMASMGEMLGNIAHQWRQPLSSISAAASGILIQKEFGQLEDTNMDNSLRAIVSNTKVLSETIDDFRNFYKKDKNFKTVSIQKIIMKTLQLIDANLKNQNIKIIKKIENFDIYTIENELTQSILNIINNAKDALMNKNKEKYIFIEVFKNENKIIINIKDNAGGIKEKHLNKIFEPYFTTKHQANGTGIGLYMTHEIIYKNLNGILKAENETYIYKNIQYTGASFTIELDVINEN